MKDYATNKTYEDFARASLLLKYDAAKRELRYTSCNPNVSTKTYEQSYCDYRIALTNKIKSDLKKLFSFH